MEKIILICNNVQAKSASSLTIKTCDLILTSERIICVALGASTLISGMLGGAIAGPSGAIAFSLDIINATNKESQKNSSKKIDQLLKNKDNYYVSYTDINKDKSTFKTGFFSTLGMWAPLTIYDNTDKRFFFNIPNKQAKEVKKTLASITDAIILK